MAVKSKLLTKEQEEQVARLINARLIHWLKIAGTIFGVLVGGGILGILYRAGVQMEKMVARQFEEPRIQHVVTEIAANRASVLMTEQIAPEVARFKQDVDDELQEVQKLVEATRTLEAEGRVHKDSILGLSTTVKDITDRVAAADRRLETVETNLQHAATGIQDLNTRLTAFNEDFRKVSEEQEFLTLANKARLFSLDAFLKLEAIAQTTNTYAKDAGQIAWALRRQMEMDRSSLTEYIPIERAENYEYRGPWTSEEIHVMIESPTAAEWGANVIRKEKLRYFVPRLVELANMEQNLWVQNRITFAIGDMAGKEFFPWTLPELNKWWVNEGKTQFTNWPSETFTSSFQHLNALRFNAAIDGFSAIMANDPYADQSRFYAIFAALMLNDIERAESFSTAWKHQEARWARLGKLAIRLDKDDRDSASTDIATLIHEFKTFPERGVVTPLNPVFRRINWEIYNKTLKELNGEFD